MTRLLLIILITCGCSGSDSKTKTLQPTEKQKNSASYQWLANHFGADNLWIQCDPDTAATVGSEYLYSVADTKDADSSYGIVYGWGGTVQEAIDNAQKSYITHDEVVAMHQEDLADERARTKRGIMYQKQCCSEVKDK